MTNGEKLARNTICVRKALKKRSNEQTTQTRRKRWQSRLLALVGCFLLFSALVVPCFADFVTPDREVVESADFVLKNMYNNQRIPTSLIGFYEIKFSSLDYTYSDNENTTLIDGTKTTVYFSFTDGTDDGIIYQAVSVSYDGGSYVDGVLVFEVYADSQHTQIVDSAFDINRVSVFVSTYPGDALNEEAFSAPGTTYTVTKFVQPSIDGVTGIWTDIMAWITNALASIQSVFYFNGSLTFLGTLAVIGVSIALAWLIIGIVTRFIQLRG